MSEHKPGDGASPPTASESTGAPTPLFGQPSNGHSKDHPEETWEDALRAGQEADGGRGSVEPELAVLHLLRHTRAPDPLPAATLDEIWGQIEPEIATLPWWKRMFDWRVGVAVAAAAAAVAVVVLVPADDPGPVADDAVARAEASVDPQLAASLQSQFELLAPNARAAIDTEVDTGRGSMRSALVAELSAADGAEDDGGAR